MPFFQDCFARTRPARKAVACDCPPDADFQGRPPLGPDAEELTVDAFVAALSGSARHSYPHRNLTESKSKGPELTHRGDERRQVWTHNAVDNGPHSRGAAAINATALGTVCLTAKETRNQNISMVHSLAGNMNKLINSTGWSHTLTCDELSRQLWMTNPNGASKHTSKTARKEIHVFVDNLLTQKIRAERATGLKVEKPPSARSRIVDIEIGQNVMHLNASPPGAFTRPWSN